MSKTREQIISELDAKIPRDVVMEREGGNGRSFSYLAGHYVIARLNEVFGQGNWHYLTKEIRQVHTGETNGKHTAHYIAVVHLQAHVGENVANFSDVGYGDGSDKQNPGKAHELAAKEAVTDALKRCAKNLGMSMGLALYDKDQLNVDDGEEEKKAPEPAAKSSQPRESKIAAMGPVPSKPSETVSPSTSTNGAGKAAKSDEPSSREETEQMISAMSKVIVQKRKKSVADLKGEMQKKYGVDAKEKLSDAQAKEFYTYLRGEL